MLHTAAASAAKVAMLSLSDVEPAPLESSSYTKPIYV